MNKNKIDNRMFIGMMIFIAVFAVGREIINLNKKPSEQQVIEFLAEAEEKINNELNDEVLQSVKVYIEDNTKVVMEYTVKIDYPKENVDNAITLTMNDLEKYDFKGNIKKMNSFLKIKDLSLLYRYLNYDSSLVFELEYNKDGFKGYKVGENYLNN